MKDPQRLVDALLERHGRTFTREAGIEVAENTPAPLFQVLCLSLLFSAPIQASVAVNAMRGLLDAGWTTANHMARASWQARVRVLNDAGYARFDEKTSTMLGEASNLLIERYGGDLRRLRRRAERKPAEERRLLEEFRGIGDVGVDIFFRDVQAAWPELRPFADRKALDGARRIGLPTGAAELADLVDEEDLPRLVTALVRMELAGDSERVLAAA